jgi:hypothetical protein
VRFVACPKLLASSAHASRIICENMPAMRAYLCVFLGAAACGSVATSNPDANPDASPDGPGSDGAAAKSGDVVWVRSMSAAFGQGVADGPGGLVFAGSITSPTDFGGGLMTPLGSADLAIGDFKADDASYIYQVRHNSANSGSVYGFLQHTDSLGNPLVYGVSYGDVDLGKGLVTGGGGAGADGFIGRYGPGAPAWVNRMVGPGDDKILCTAPAPGGDIYAGGWFEGTTSWNGGQLVSAGGRDFFVARMNTYTGAIAATPTFGGTGRDEISSIAGDGTTLIVGGFFNDTLAMGGTAQPITATAGAQEASLDAFVAKLDAQMKPVWAVRFGGVGEERGTAVALDPGGDVYVTGQFQGQVAFGAVNLTSVDPIAPLGMPQKHDIFVARLHGENGSVAWAVRFGAAEDDGPNRIVIDAAGHPAIIGGLNNDAVIASFEPNNGAVRWQKVIATTGADYGWTMSVGTTGDLYAVVDLGVPGTAIDFGKPLIGPPAAASVIMRIVP